MLRIAGFIGMLAVFAACSDVYVRNMDAGQVVPYKALVAGKVGLEGLAGKVLRLDAGDAIPVRLELDTPLVGLERKDVRVVLKRPVYVSVEPPAGTDAAAFAAAAADQAALGRLLARTKVALSLDGKRWAPLSSFAGLKEAFSIKGGQLSIGFSISKERGDSIDVVLKTISG